ncbi:MAG: tetratricopeptide repeat protein [Myxococcaceae bacterium]
MTPKRLLDGGAKGPGEQGAAELLEQSGPLPHHDDLAQERVWRALQKNLPEPKKQGIPRWVLATAGVGALAAVAIFFAPVRLGAPVGGAVELTAGPVVSADPGKSWNACAAGDVLLPGSRVRTNSGQSLLKLSRAALLVSSQSDLAIESMGRDTFLRLAEGKVLAEVEHRAPNESFVVQTTRYKVTVRGTIFSVHERAADDVTVSVSRGLVEVSGEGGTWMVSAGKSWNSRSPDVLSADQISANDRALVASVESTAPRALIRVDGSGEVSEGGMVLGPAPLTWAAPVGQYHFTGPDSQADATTVDPQHPATVRMLPSPAGEGARRADEVSPQTQPVVQEEHTAAPPPPPKQHHKVKSSSTVARDESPLPPSGAASDEPQTPAISNGAATGLDKPTPPAPASSDPYGDAVKASRDHHYDEAAQLFSRAAELHNARSHMALYELGRLQQVDLHLPSAALDTFSRYQREYPSGTLIQEVEISVIEIELQQRSFDDALTNMNSFLSRHANSERASELHLRRADLFRARGDCAKAIDDYAQAKAPAQADDATYFTAWCEQRMGERDDAEKSLRKYLDRFPSGRHAKEARAVLGEKF